VKHHEQHARLAYDEQRAINDLQNLQRAIQHARGDRERAEAEFDEFLRGFHSKEQPEPQSKAAAAPPQFRHVAAPVVSPAPAPPPETAAFEPEPPQVEDQPVAVAATTGADRTLEAPKSLVPPRRRRDLRPAVGLTIAALVVTGGLLALRGRRAAIPAQEEPSSVVSTRPEEASAEAASPPAETATPQSGVNLEMMTVRPVWVRVTVDGRRAIERELDAGQRIPLHGERTIVIRAGDAGAVSVRRDGGAATRLGPDGIVATRAFESDAAAR
jgi:hypothetical protein